MALRKHCSIPPYVCTLYSQDVRSGMENRVGRGLAWALSAIQHKENPMSSEHERGSGMFDLLPFSPAVPLGWRVLTMTERRKLA